MAASNNILFSAHPINLVAIEILISAFVIGFTSPDSPTRLEALPLITAATWRILATCPTDISSVLWASFIAGNAMTYLLLYIDLALIGKWSFAAGGPAVVPGEITASSQRPNNDQDTFSFWVRVKFGLNAVLSQRRVGTSQQVKNVPAFRTSDPSYVPSKVGFLTRNLWIMILCYLIVDASSLAANPEMSQLVFAPAKVPLLSRVDQITVEELAIRALSCLTVAINVCTILQFGYSLLASITVITGISQVQDWRPPFGSFSNIYTIRKFWGTLWHQMFRHTFSSPAKFIIHHILHLPPHTALSRYATLLLTFTISGLFHHQVDIASGIPASETGSLRFFITQALGILVEDTAQAIYRSTLTPKQPPRSSPPLLKQLKSEPQAKPKRHWTHLAGSVWLVSFLVWSSPAVVYPAIRRNRGEAKDEILPFSVLAYLWKSFVT